jgi:NAD(P) transhydrogenase subunit alpha
MWCWRSSRPAIEVISQMQEGAILVSFIYANREPALVQMLLDRKITCFAMERAAHHACAVDGRALQPVRAGGLLRRAARRDHLGRVLPKITTAAGAIGPAKVWSWALASPALRRSRPRIAGRRGRRL